MGRKVYVVGVGMTKFEKPGSKPDWDYPQMGEEAATAALDDAGVPYSSIQQACVGYVYGDSTCGQRSVYGLGLSGIPIFNVNNNCATGASALYLAKQIVESGNADCVLALGFEKMEKGSLSSKFNDRTNPLDKHVENMIDLAGIDASPVPAQLFGNAGIEHMKKYGTNETHFAKIAYKNHKHSVNNPNSQFRDVYTLEQIMNSPKVFGPLTKLQCCPTSDGAAAVVLASEAFVIKHGLKSRAVEILGMEMATDFASSFSKSCMKIVGYDMTAAAAKSLFEKTKKSPGDVDVVELHDCFSANELITYEALGLCPEGQAGKMIDNGDNTYGGKYVINPSGGLISKGHPLGATGLAQCTELVWQLRGEAGPRQVKGAKLALQHNLGLGGAVVVALYANGFPSLVKNKVAATITSTEGFKVHRYMQILEQVMLDDTENLIERVRGVYGFRVKNGPGGAEAYWVINAKVGKGSVKLNGSDKPDVTFTVNDDDTVDLITGTLNPQKAFFQGKIKVQGNMGLALKLTELLNVAGHRIAEIRSKL